jgi:hypothetical protein
MYTKENLEAIEKAISDLQSGRRVVGASYGDTRVQYANISLADLISLKTYSDPKTFIFVIRLLFPLFVH